MNYAKLIAFTWLVLISISYTSASEIEVNNFTSSGKPIFDLPFSIRF
jgi:hypothetical protein